MVGTTQALGEYAVAARARIESALVRYLQGDAVAAISQAGVETWPPRLAEAMQYAALGGGKRLRALLALLAAEACGGSEAAAMPVACAVEMIHAYSLVHDDLPAMDDDDLRRGRPTNHRVFGEAMAILAGDALLTRAFEIVAGEVRPAEVAARCCAELGGAAGASGMVGGQADDIDGAFQAGSLEQLERIHARKTGAMLAVSLKLGGLVAGASSEQLAALAAYGRAVGIAFQIADDLLDVAGDEAKIGKRVRKDAEQGKLTYPGLLGIEESRRRAQALVADAARALEPLGAAGSLLEELARYVVERDR
ncbi:MAG: polyprenyl synthetase family protein [Pirellulales bacterium]|nr:polyprenyl synthetase family protein [Pirellulales bacterium]